MNAVGLEDCNFIDELDKDLLAFDRDRNMYVLDDTNVVAGLESQKDDAPEQFFESDPLGLGIGCIEHAHSDDASSDGTPDEKRERAERLHSKFGPRLTGAATKAQIKLPDPSEVFPHLTELVGVRFGEKSASSQVFPRPA